MLVILEKEIIGIENMSDFNIKPIQNELKIKALMVPAFRVQVKGTLNDTPIAEILEVAKMLEES